MLEAIAECQGQRNPNATTCIKLAAYYTILDNMKKESKPEDVPEPMYSYDEPKDDRYYSESEFGQIVYEREATEVLKVVDELMETLRVMQPRLYDAFMRKLSTL